MVFVSIIPCCRRLKVHSVAVVLGEDSKLWLAICQQNNEWCDYIYIYICMGCSFMSVVSSILKCSLLVEGLVNANKVRNQYRESSRLELAIYVTPRK